MINRSEIDGLELHKRLVNINEVPVPNQDTPIPTADDILTIGDLHTTN